MTPKPLSPRLRSAFGVIGLLAAVAVPPVWPRDPRSVEVVRLDCSSDLGRRDITLFENGTLRVRRWDESEEMDMNLVDLELEEIEGFLARLEALDLSEVEADPPTVSGGWLETCRLRLDRGAEEAPEFRFSRATAIPLALSKLAGWVEELGLRAAPGARVRDLPANYVPAPGDVLLRHDGLRYEVLGWTSDGRALELLGVDRPLTLYVFPDGFQEEFSALVERGSR